MALKKIKLNSAGFTALLNGAEIRSNLTKRGNAIEAGLPTNNGEEWEVSTFQGKDRTNVTVRTKNQAAREASAENNVIVRNLGAGA